MVNAQDMFTNPGKFMRDTLTDIGAPPTDIFCVRRNVCIEKGGELKGLAFYVVQPGESAGKQYNSETEARQNIQEGGRIYRIDVYRTE